MKTCITRTFAFTLMTTIAAAAMLAADVSPQQATPKQITDVSPIPTTPAAIRELVLARPFTLERGYVHEYRKEKPQVDAGMIIVVRVDSDLARARQVAQPVLMVGAQVVEPMNVGYASGFLVAIVPAQRKTDGTVDLDLAKTPIYFGQPELPETMDQVWVDAQRRAADASGLKPVAGGVAEAALARGGTIAKLADREALDRAIGALVRTYAVDETERADQLEGKIDSTPRVVK